MDRQDGSSSPPLTQTSIRTEKDGMVDDQPKEPLFLSAEERYGYYPAASYDQKVGNSQYIIVRKVCLLSSNSAAVINPPVAWMGSVLHSISLQVRTALYTWCSI